jgi:nucleoside-diphosphate-sugar epimerase
MRTLVIGGTGYMGHHILARLLERGHDVAVVSRGKLQPDVLRNVQLIQVDRKDRDAFHSALSNERFDTVIDNIAYESADVEHAMRTFGGHIGQYMLTSTMGVYHDITPLAPLPESAADLTFVTPEGYTKGGAGHVTMGHKYADQKRHAERLLTEVSPDVFQFTIMRPPMVMGSDDRTRRVWWYVQRVLDGGPFVITDYGPGHLFHLIYVPDLARAYAIAAGNPAAMGKIYNVNNSEIFIAETWIEAIGTGLGRQTSWERIPADRLASVGLEKYVMPIAARPYGNSLGDNSALRYDLGFEFTPQEDWIKETAQGCADNPPPGDSDGYERRSDEVAAALRFRQARERMLAAL